MKRHPPAPIRRITQPYVDHVAPTEGRELIVWGTILLAVVGLAWVFRL